ncbi:MAG: hypothetical protein R3C68_00440 [Myxococcota bacterium]
MNHGMRLTTLFVLGLLPVFLVLLWVGAAGARLDEFAQQKSNAPAKVAIAQATDANYCSVELKRILRRVLQSCGLLGSGGTRGCQPLQAKNVATVSGDDFNALFMPMRERGGIIQFESEGAELDQDDQQLAEHVFADQRGASYFFVVARASPEGDTTYNRHLSQRRAEAVMEHLRTKFQDPDLEREVGLLWLGEEFAQLDEGFCSWRRSTPGDACRPRDVNRSAFLAWIDCTL